MSTVCMLWSMCASSTAVQGLLGHKMRSENGLILEFQLIFIVMITIDKTLPPADGHKISLSVTWDGSVVRNDVVLVIEF